MSRYYITLAAEVEAPNEKAALDGVDALCTTITCGAGESDYWEERHGIVRLTYDDRGDGPVITPADEEPVS